RRRRRQPRAARSPVPADHALPVCACGRKFFFASRRRHTRFSRDWSSDVCSSDLAVLGAPALAPSVAAAAPRRAESRTPTPAVRRSEEHTSELQSRENLVCRLLLEKKKII